MVRGDWVLFHPVYSPEELKAVEVTSSPYPPRYLTSMMHPLFPRSSTANPRHSRIPLLVGSSNLHERCFDIVSGYKHKPLPADWKSWPIEKLRAEGYVLDDKAWLRRILFLESIAGVPGMVAATLRHLQSLRLMRRDSGWIHTCLEEAENERMHLMTFMTLRKPSLFFRGIVLGAQGVFYNLFFLSYLVSPKTCHRFVGYLEEEAVVTYTKCIKDIENGLIPEWTDMPAPEISIDYWRLPKDAKMIDLVYAVRSDETTHRFVNHSLANLNADTDVNPFALREPDMHTKGKTIE
ncbi:alternative oxidase [Coprinellus micaceus]|uniref:Alternative oxidase n=1 Tax=Coprinellus micaceus TaxID=71717 RepID=A0A4Y7U1J1_COPMI|nr:alternative oxidase [Coprinellus micaceus]